MHTNTPTQTFGADELWSKVPEITLWFWIIKMFSTTVGETFADFLNVNLGLGLSVTSLIMGGLLAGALIWQVRAARYEPPRYWLTVVLVSVAGTLLTDNLVDHLGITLPALSLMFSFGLAATFTAWYAVEKTLSIHSITSTRREMFYWLAILLTFALGTAVGDLAAEALKLGYFNAMLVFGGLIAAVATAHFVLKINPVLTFWAAYILTRPLGASIGDLLSQPTSNGGLGLGTTITSVLMLAVIVALVAWLSITRKDAILLNGQAQVK